MSTLEVVFVAALAAKLAAELILSFLNRRYLQQRSAKLPPALQGIMDDETFDKSNRYTLAKSRFGTLNMIFDAALLAVVLLSGILPIAFAAWGEWLGTAAWSGALFLIAVIFVLGIPGLPFEYWQQFKIEQRFGFNRSTLGLWIMDKLKGGLVGVLIGFPLLWLLLSLVTWLGEYWWVYGFALMFAFQLVMMVLYPMLIMPLFNKLEPLADGPLKDRLMAMSDKAGFKCNAIQVIDGSKRSAHSNAYFTGFGRFRRIVLFDTLIEQLGEAEIEAVLAHEIGHYKMGHIPKMIGTSALMMFLGFWLVGALAESETLFAQFGFEAPSMALAFLLFSLVGGLFTFWFTPVFNLMSRKHEYEADAFAVKVVGDWKPLSNALRQLSEKNLSNLQPHPAFSGFYHSHPNLLERERGMQSVTVEA